MSDNHSPMTGVTFKEHKGFRKDLESSPTSSQSEELPETVQHILGLIPPFTSESSADDQQFEDPTLKLLLFAVEVTSALRDVVRIYKHKESIFAKSVGSRLVAALTGEIGKLVIYSLTNDWGEETELASCFHVVVKKILGLFPEMTTRRHKVSGKMLIHHTCLKSHSSLAVDYINTLLEACPSSVSSPDAHGALPLHWCLRNRHPNTDVLRLLIERYPLGPTTRDSKGFIPLHWAVHQQTPHISIIEELLKAFPDGAKQPCGTGGLPLHWAVNQDSPSLPIVCMLYEAYPEAIRTPCKEGCIPLHRAVDRANPNIEVVSFLIDKYPEGLHHPCRYGQFPLHKAMDHASAASLTVVSLLLQLHPAAAKVSDQDGYLPLHVCLDTRSPNDEMVRLLLKAFPDAARRPTIDGLLPLHMVVGTNANPSLNIVNMLMQLHPLGCQTEVVDYVPKDETANAATWQGEWVETKWTPLSRAIDRGLNDIVLLFRDILVEKGLLSVDPVTGDYYLSYEAGDTVNTEDSSEIDSSRFSTRSESQQEPQQFGIFASAKSLNVKSATSPDQTPVRLRPQQIAPNPRMVRSSPLYGGRLPAQSSSMQGSNEPSRGQHPFQTNHNNSRYKTDESSNSSSLNAVRQHGSSADLSEDSWDDQSVKTYSSANSSSSMRSLMFHSSDEDMFNNPNVQELLMMSPAVHPPQSDGKPQSAAASVIAFFSSSSNSQPAANNNSSNNVATPKSTKQRSPSSDNTSPSTLTSKSPSSLSKLIFKLPGFSRSSSNSSSNSSSIGRSYSEGIATKSSKLSESPEFIRGLKLTDEVTVTDKSSGAHTKASNSTSSLSNQRAMMLGIGKARKPASDATYTPDRGRDDIV